jgi:hypothetical protein
MRLRLPRWPATSAAACSLTAIGEWAADAPGQVLAAVGTRRDPLTGAFRPPTEATVRRVLGRVDPDALDQVIGRWLACQHAHADWLVGVKQVDYVLIVKANQPSLYRQLSTLPWRAVPVADHTHDRGHGRRVPPPAGHHDPRPRLPRRHPPAAPVGHYQLMTALSAPGPSCAPPLRGRVDGQVEAACGSRRRRGRAGIGARLRCRDGRRPVGTTIALEVGRH